MSETAAGRPVTRVECPGSKDLFVRRLIVTALVVGGGVLILADPSVNGHEWKAGDVNNNGYFLYNYYLPYVLLAMGLVLLVRALFDHNRRLLADEKGIGYAGKEQIAWGQITRIDATLLASKGLLTLHYTAGQGESALKLDSYNFRNFRDVVALVERCVSADKIKR